MPPSFNNPPTISSISRLRSTSGADSDPGNNPGSPTNDDAPPPPRAFFPSNSSPSSVPLSHPNNSPLPDPLSHYLQLCSYYSTRPNPGIMTCLRYSLSAIRPTPPFHDRDTLPLADTFFVFANTGTVANLLDHVTRLDFTLAARSAMPLAPSVRGLRSHGAVTIANMVAHSKTLRAVKLDRNKIGSYGAAALAKALGTNRSVEALGLRGCAIGEGGARAFADDAFGAPNRLASVDLSLNMIGFEGVTRMAQALQEREEKG
ncbi:hypothetical protein TeGR_g6655, partial [Tetraparma gracilis]